LSGGSNFRLNLPANIPANNFWSVTLYEAENASGLAKGQPFPSLGSRDKPMQNADGSTDLYLGPNAPEGKAGNWLATVPDRGYFAIFRLRPDRSRHQQELEAWRYREGEVTRDDQLSSSSSGWLIAASALPSLSNRNSWLSNLVPTNDLWVKEVNFRRRAHCP
jgi:hypothetical protein